MSDTVFILGAGTSVDAGVPLMGNFLEEAKKMWKNKEIKDADEDFDRVFEAYGKLHPIHSKTTINTYNLEEVISIFEMANMLGSFENYKPRQLKDIIRSFKTVIAKTIENSMKLKVNNGQIMPFSLHKRFADLIRFFENDARPKHSVSVITFNYDIGIDYAFHANKYISYSYGLDSKRDNKDNIPLMKLHGSINWGTCSKCKAIVPYYLHTYFNGRNISANNGKIKITIGSELNKYDHCGEEFPLLPEPVIIPPCWDKFYHSTKLSQVWKQAAKELSEAENIFIIGYSYPKTDAFFRYLYALGSVGNSVINNFRVYNIDEKLETHYRELIGASVNERFEYIPETFEYAIGDIILLFS
ncbi:MAG: hypothetical protein HOC71_03410 [Candidatus Latescibacteria bacterium]|jgi:NAD-dependent SIR2 family protein deacetylase|nr:hypothetical protein [Candidatus Latescibacterota bacterium]